MASLDALITTNDAALTGCDGKPNDIPPATAASSNADLRVNTEMLMDFSLSDDLFELKGRTERFVREQVLRFETDPRQTSHGPSEDLRRELLALGRQANLLSPHVGRDWGGLGLDHCGKAVV